MAHHKSANKRIRSSETRRIRNRIMRKKLHTLTKAVRSAEKKADAEHALKAVSSYLDQLASRKIVHKNKAANYKSKLTRSVNSL